MKVLLPENFHPDAGAVLAAAGHAVVREPHSPARKVLARKIGDVSVPGIRSKT